MLRKCQKLYTAAGTFDVVEKGDLVAIKLHVGEYGNPFHIKPLYVREIVDEVLARGGKPFLTDSNTLYKVKRHNAVDHERTAWAHGFNGIAPFVVADGLRGENGKTVPTKGILEEIEVAGAIAEADAMIVVSHAKGHGNAGVGGAIKNLGMGCCTRMGKRAQHRSVGLNINVENCEGCGNCVDACFMDAAKLTDNKVDINEEECMCCGTCADVCENDVLSVGSKDNINRALASAAYGVLSTFKPGKVSFVSFAINISKLCDCASNPGRIVHPDIGVFASDSPVSIDAAVMNIIGNQLAEMHKIDPFIQPKSLKEHGIEGDLEPDIIDI
jgi:uncharacterized Fe-S center protein